MLWSRNGNNISASFPEIVDALRSVLEHRETVLDGEIVALGPDGVPSFSLLQRRMHVLRPTAQLRNEAVTSYYVFDVLDIDGTSTSDLPYLERREALANLSLEHPRIKVPPHWLNVDGPTMLEVARKHHLEGIVAKNISSIYQSGKRSRDWIKTPLRANCEAVVCGFLPGSGGAAGGVGSLILGAHDDSRVLRYIGNVGTGLTDRQRRELRDKLVELHQPISRSLSSRRERSPAMHPGRGRSLSATWNTASTPVAAFGTHPFEGCATTRPPMRSTYRVVTESLQQCKSERFADGQFGGCIGARFRSLSKRRDHLRARMYQTRMARRDASEQYARKPPISIQVRSPKGPGLYQRNLDFTTAASGEVDPPHSNIAHAPSQQ